MVGSGMSGFGIFLITILVIASITLIIVVICKAVSKANSEQLKASSSKKKIQAEYASKLKQLYQAYLKDPSSLKEEELNQIKEAGLLDKNEIIVLK